jgi:hypothetical protein
MIEHLIGGVLDIKTYTEVCIDIVRTTASADGVVHLLMVECDIVDNEVLYDLRSVEVGKLYVHTIDHHRPDDPGYNGDPVHFWRSSSLGQTYKVLHMLELIPRNIMVIKDHLYAAAADHCLQDAYKEICPGIYPEVLAAWRAATRAQYQGVRVQDIVHSVNQAIEVINSAPTLALDPSDPDHTSVRDLRSYGRVSEANEASAIIGVPILYEMDYTGTTITGIPLTKKVGLLGGTTKHVDAFMSTYAENIGLLDVYGNTFRGYAGGYLT